MMRSIVVESTPEIPYEPDKPEDPRKYAPPERGTIEQIAKRYFVGGVDGWKAAKALGFPTLAERGNRKIGNGIYQSLHAFEEAEKEIERVRVLAKLFK